MSYLEKENYKAWNIRLDEYKQTWTIDQKAKFFARFGLLAPSGHNSQPWVLDFQDSKLILKINQNRSLIESDPNMKQLMISLGCFTENAVQAASFFGYDSEVICDVNAVWPLITINFSKSAHLNSTQPDHIATFITKRSTDRGRYQPTLVDQQFRSQIKSLVSDNIHLAYIETDNLKTEFARIAIDSQIKIMDNEGFRDELSEFIRSSFTHKKTGMTGFALEIPAPISLVASKLIKKVNLSKKSRAKDFELLTKYTPAYIIISTLKDDKLGWFSVGRTFQKLWLTAERSNLKLSPWAAPIQDNDSLVSLQKKLQINHVPAVFTRIGYPLKRKKKHTPRLLLSDVMR